VIEANLQARVGDLSLDLRLEAGAEPLAIIGPNGAGKTSALRAIAGMLRPQTGRLTVSGRLLFDSSRGIDMPVHQRNIAYVPQGYGLFEHLSVLDNVAFGLTTRARGGGFVNRLCNRRQVVARRQAAAELLTQLGGGALVGKGVRELSGGGQQRVALARALITSPDLLLLDEPLAAIDVSARRKLRERLAAHLVQRSVPAIVVTHDARDVLALGARVCVMDGGSITQQGSVAEVSDSPTSEFAAEFFQGLLPPFGDVGNSHRATSTT